MEETGASKYTQSHALTHCQKQVFLKSMVKKSKKTKNVVQL